MSAPQLGLKRVYICYSGANTHKLPSAKLKRSNLRLVASYFAFYYQSCKLMVKSAYDSVSIEGGQSQTDNHQVSTVQLDYLQQTKERNEHSTFEIKVNCFFHDTFLGCC